MPKAGKIDDEEVDAEGAIDTKNEVYQDSNSKEKSGTVVANYQKTEPTGLPIGTPESIITTHEEQPPAMTAVEVHPGPVTARFSCPFLIKRNIHPIPYIRR